MFVCATKRHTQTNMSHFFGDVGNDGKSGASSAAVLFWATAVRRRIESHTEREKERE